MNGSDPSPSEPVLPDTSTSWQSPFVRTLIERGFVHSATDLQALDHITANGTITAYIGFDATAPSLHVGSLVPIMMLYWLQQTGHRPIALMGGGTSLIGDPSGKTTERTLLSSDQIAENIAGIESIFGRFLHFDSPTQPQPHGKQPASLLNNAHWLTSVEYIPFLRDIGRHFSINRMLGFDSIRLRLEREQPLSFIEFNYLLLQSFDFLTLYQQEACVLQMGGSDQWGNIVSGIDLIRRVCGVSTYGITSPLVTLSDGRKMGKTEDQAIWLSPTQLSDHDYWQYWRNTPDADVTRFMKLFTTEPLEAIHDIALLEGQHLNEHKERLADATTELCRGPEAVERARWTAARFFGPPTLAHASGDPGADPHEPDTPETPETVLRRSDLSPNGAQPAWIDVFVQTGIVETRSQYRRLLRQGGLRVGGQRLPTTSDLVPPETTVTQLSVGRKRHVQIRLIP